MQIAELSHWLAPQMSLKYVKIFKFSYNSVKDLVHSTLTIYYPDINKIPSPRFSHITVNVHLYKKFLNSSLRGNTVDGKMYTGGIRNRTTVVILC